MLRNTRGKSVARRATVTAIALLVPVLAGCEAGADAPTLAFHPAANGAHAVVNDISINNVFVLGPAEGSTLPVGGSAGMFLGLYNGSGSADQLVGASAPGTATSVTISNGSINIAPGTSALLTGPQPEVVLKGLTRPLAGGQSIPVTLDFSNTGSVTLQVPVEPYDYYYTLYSQAPASPTAAPMIPASPTASAGASPSASPSASASPRK